MSKRIYTTLSDRYVSNWDPTYALREFIQNYLDVVSDGTTGSIYYDDLTQEIVVSDCGAGLSLRHLALGISEKSSSQSKGMFGEGLKLGLLVYARGGRVVTVQSVGSDGGLLVTPVIETHPDLGVPVLALDVGRTPESIPGTVLRAACSRAEYRAARRMFADTDPDLNRLTPGISLPGGALYVNGARASNLTHTDSQGLSTPSHFSYHLEVDHDIDPLLFNRDRTVVDMPRAEGYIRQVLGGCDHAMVLSSLMTRCAQPRSMGPACWESYHMPYWYHIAYSCERAWKQAVTEAFPDCYYPAKDPAINTLARAQGLRVLDISEYPGTMQDLLSSAMASTVVQLKKMQYVTYVARASLSSYEKRSLRWAISTVRRLYADPGKVRVATTLLQDSDGTQRAAGMYLRDKGEILILRPVLADPWDTLHTLLHETVHRQTDTVDCTTEFEYELNRATIRVLRNLHGGRRLSAPPQEG